MSLLLIKELIKILTVLTCVSKMTAFCLLVFHRYCRYIITDVIGKDDGLGVENLRGSGTIAGESSHAYEEIVTISMVRNVLWISWIEGNLCDII